MFDSLLVTIFTGYCAVGLVGLTSCLIGANIYDIKQAKTKHNIQLHPYAKHNRHRPLISIVLYIKDRDQPVIKCLESIRRSSYRNYEIIVVDDTVQDNSINKEVLAYRNKHPKYTLRLVKRRKKTNRDLAISAATKRWARGELLMHLDANSVLDKYALKNICQYFIVEQVSTLIPNAQIASYPSIVGLFQQLDQLWQSSIKKLISIGGLTRPYEMSGLVYRQTSKLTKLKRESVRVKYGSDVLVISTPATSWAKLLKSMYRCKVSVMKSMRLPKSKLTKKHRRIMPKIIYATWGFLFWLVVIMTPLVISYLLYLAVYFKQSALYGLSWIIFSLVVFSVIWGAGYIKISKRIHLTLLLPIMYVIFYMLSILRLFVLTATSIVALRNVVSKAA